MSIRFSILLLLYILVISTSSYGATACNPPDGSLKDASARMLEKDYKGAFDSAIKAPESGMRDFLLGMAMTRLGDWERSAEYLGRASSSFPMLADYTLFNRAYSLSRLARYPEAMTVLQLFVKLYPDSPLFRTAKKLQADTLYDSSDFQGAIDAYGEFTAKYSSGADALEARYKSAISMERIGQIPSAINVLKKVWLSHPASSYAEKAREDIGRLVGDIPSKSLFTPEELMARGNILYDLGRYGRAEETFAAIPRENQSEDFICRLIFKTGQAKYRAKKLEGAEQDFRLLLTKDRCRDLADEAQFWLAKTLDRSGNEDGAFDLYLMLAEKSPTSSLADNALLAAYFIRKFQNRGNGAQKLLMKLEASYPDSNLLNTALWEIALQSYMECDFNAAASYFKKLLNDNIRREKALYWYYRSLVAVGEKNGADRALSTLLKEYPIGFYALNYGKDRGSRLPWTFPEGTDIQASLNEPAGFDRAKVLIDLGLYDEAKTELSWSKRRNAENYKLLTAISKLYLRMGDFNRSSSMINTEYLMKQGNSPIEEWEMAYPMAFKVDVARNATASGLAESLIYAIIRAESNYSPTAVSPAGAVGLMQMMPATARAIDKTIGSNNAIEHVKRPEINIRLGVKHLKYLLELYDGDAVLAVAAYNAGEGNVNRWIKRLGKIPRDLFIENIPFAETREYVKKVLSGMEIYSRLYKITLPRPHHLEKKLPASGETPFNPSPDIPEKETPTGLTLPSPGKQYPSL